MQIYNIFDLKLDMFFVIFIHKKHVFSNSPVADANAWTLLMPLLI